MSPGNVSKDSSSAAVGEQTEEQRAQDAALGSAWLCCMVENLQEAFNNDKHDIRNISLSCLLLITDKNISI